MGNASCIAHLPSSHLVGEGSDAVYGKSALEVAKVLVTRTSHNSFDNIILE